MSAHASLRGTQRRYAGSSQPARNAEISAGAADEPQRQRSDAWAHSPLIAVNVIGSATEGLAIVIAYEPGAVGTCQPSTAEPFSSV